MSKQRGSKPRKPKSVSASKDPGLVQDVVPKDASDSESDIEAENAALELSGQINEMFSPKPAGPKTAPKTEAPGSANSGSTKSSESKAGTAPGLTAPKKSSSNTGTGSKPETENKAPSGSAESSQSSGQSISVAIPQKAAWFRSDVVSLLERKALPEFFENKEGGYTSESYREMRDFMIKTYRSAPSVYLTVTACRTAMVADVTAVTRIHNFLEQWGLINFAVDEATRPRVLPVQSDGQPMNMPEAIVTTKPPRGRSNSAKSKLAIL